MKRPTARWLLAALLASVLLTVVPVVVLTRGEADVDVDALLADTPQAVDEQGRAHLVLSVEIDGDELEIAVDGTGAVDFGEGTGWLNLDLPGTSVELRTNGETLFVLPSGQTTWLAAHADEAAGLGAFATGPSEAIAFVDLLRGATEDVEDVGTEEIDGVEARHLRLTVDLATGAGAAGEQSRPAIEALRAFAADRVLPLEVWIDDRNLPVRQRVRGEVQGLPVVVTIDLARWGEPLDVAIPPEGAVRDIEADELTRVFGGPPPG
ncbi:MAG TPA: hypothetical protein VFU93_05205 [Acidimicrobiales bacterium]|nr:hypothetical protein [Acidimicrobiales bacterium]